MNKTQWKENQKKKKKLIAYIKDKIRTGERVRVNEVPHVY